MNHLKNAWKSLTIWFNSLAGIVVMMGDTIKENLPMMQQYMTAENVKVAAIVVVAINVALRFKTNSSLADK